MLVVCAALAFVNSLSNSVAHLWRLTCEIGGLSIASSERRVCFRKHFIFICILRICLEKVYGDGGKSNKPPL